MRLLGLTWCVLLLAGRTLPAEEQSPRDKLLRLVPKETAICLVVQNLRTTAQTISTSPLADWFAQKYRPMIRSSAEVKKLENLETLLSRFLGVTLTDLRDEIFGDVVVLAYQPGPVGKPEAEQGCMLLWARDPLKLSKLISKLNSVQQTTQEIRGVEELRYRNQSYYKRLKGDDTSEFYLLKDNLFVFAGQEQSIRSVIEQSQLSPRSISPVVESMEKLGVQDAFVTVWLNPRPLDNEIQAHVTSAQTAQERSSRQQFARIWSALDPFALYVKQHEELELGLSLTYRPEMLPPELRDILRPSPEGANLWQQIPTDALFAMSGHVTGEQLWRLFQSFSPADERAISQMELERAIGAIIGKNKLPALLSGTGPDWAFWIAPPKGNQWFPDVAAVVRLASHEPSVASNMLKVLHFYSQLLQVTYNRNHDDQIESEEQVSQRFELTIWNNDRLFPAEVRPTFGVVDQYLILGSSLSVAQSFRTPDRREEPSTTPFMRISGRYLERYLNQHHAKLAGWIAHYSPRTEAELSQELLGIAGWIGILDYAELRLTASESSAKLILNMKFIQPLAK